MNIVFGTWKYIFRNFWYVLPFAVAPALFLSLTLNYASVRGVLTGFFTGDPAFSFYQIFTALSFIRIDSWWGALYSVCAFICMVVFLAIMLSLVEKHMRIGKRSFNGAFSRLNDNIVSSFFVTLLYCAIYELWSLVTAAVLYAFGALVLNAVGVYILSLLFFIGLIYALLFVVSVFYLWLPCLQITGFRAYDALRYSYQLVSNIRGKLILAQALSLLTANIVVGLSAIYLPALPFQIITFVVFLLLFAEFCVRMEVAYFETENLDREDLLRSYREL